MSEFSWLDASLYPHVNPPECLETLVGQVDFLARLCSAWDFGILPALSWSDHPRNPKRPLPGTGVACGA